MINSLVSVIIPIYNVEKYLVKCVESVRNQSYDNLQIILVDDGSQDLSGRLCDEQAEMDSRILVIHKTNGGLSEARNAGLAWAIGEYIFYLDSDDYLEHDAIECLLNCRQDGQIVVGNYYYTYENYEDIAKYFYENNTVLNTQEAMEGLVSGKIQNFAWGKLIQADIAKRYLFPKGKLFEDHYWAHFVLNDAEKIVVLDKPIVHYRQRNDSISYTFNLNRLDILDGWIDRKQFLEEHYPELMLQFMINIAEQYLNIAWLVLTRMNKSKKKAFDKLRAYNQQLKLQNYVVGDEKRLITKLDKNVLMYAIATILRRVKRGK